MWPFLNDPTAEYSRGRRTLAGAATLLGMVVAVVVLGYLVNTVGDALGM